METRKVQFVGGTTFSVTLPKPWAVQHGLQVGASLGVAPQPDGSLLLRPLKADGERAPHPYTLDVDGLTAPQLERRVVALYMAGADRIELVARRPFAAGFQATIEGLPRRLSGLEVVEKGPNHVILQGLLDPSEFDVLKAFDLSYANAASIHRANLASLSQGTPLDIDALKTRLGDIDRLVWVATKQIRRIHGTNAVTGDQRMDPADALLFSSAISLVHRLGQYGLRMTTATRALSSQRLDDRIGAGIVELGSRALHLCDEAARAFYKADLAAADQAFDRVEPFEARSAELQRFAAGRAMECQACGFCLAAIQVIEWLHASVVVGARLAELATLRAVSARTP